ncbi:MAG: DUF805 domain-containing protein [Dysgonomonas sp.]
MEYFFSVIKKHYADFDSRIRRKDFWGFILVTTGVIITAFIIGFLFALISETLAQIMFFITGLFILAIMIPSLAICVRRVHDTGKNGWYILIPIYNIILYITEGEKGDNKYGPDPKANERINQKVNSKS